MIHCKLLYFLAWPLLLGCDEEGRLGTGTPNAPSQQQCTETPDFSVTWKVFSGEKEIEQETNGDYICKKGQKITIELSNSDTDKEISVEATIREPATTDMEEVIDSPVQDDPAGSMYMDDALVLTPQKNPLSKLFDKQGPLSVSFTPSTLGRHTVTINMQKIHVNKGLYIPQKNDTRRLDLAFHIHKRAQD